MRATPEDARILVYPAGRNARLAVSDATERGFPGGQRTMVGFADDQPPDGASDCATLTQALQHHQPTHILVCARDPSLEDALVDKARRTAPAVEVLSARSSFIENAPLQKREPRALSDIRNLTIVICKTCNLRCSFCYQTDFTERMDPVIFREKLAALYPHVDVLQLVGGEVTAYPHALPFVQTLPDRYPQMKLRMTTNGVMFDQHWADVFCRTGGSVHNSIIAVTASTYRKVTGQDQHAAVVRNVERTLRMRDERGSELAVCIGMVVVPDTQYEVEALVMLGNSLGVDRVEIGVDTMQTHFLDRKALREQVDRIAAAGLSLHVHWDRLSMVLPDLPIEPTVTAPCTLPDSAIFVEANGTVYVCCHSHVALGSLVTDDIQTIWNAPAARAVAHDVQSGRCASCPQDCIYRAPTVRLAAR